VWCSIYAASKPVPRSLECRIHHFTRCLAGAVKPILSERHTNSFFAKEKGWAEEQRPTQLFGAAVLGGQHFFFLFFIALKPRVE
jgi:hypothetical protein